MEGNVLEWCKDSYDENYHNKDKKDVSQRVVRGGFWLSAAAQCRAAFRLPVDLLYHASGVGFRVVVRLRERQVATAR
jgi:sulfatase modifying factor 1